MIGFLEFQNILASSQSESGSIVICFVGSDFKFFVTVLKLSGSSLQAVRFIRSGIFGTRFEIVTESSFNFGMIVFLDSACIWLKDIPLFPKARDSSSQKNPEWVIDFSWTDVIEYFLESWAFGYQPYSKKLFSSLWNAGKLDNGLKCRLQNQNSLA